MTPSPQVSLLLAEVLLIWNAANYMLTRGGQGSAWLLCRAVLAAAATIAAAGGASGWPLAAVMLLGCLLLPIARRSWVAPQYMAELEVASSAGFAALSQWVIARCGLHATWFPEWAPWPEPVVSAFVASLAIVVFVVGGGTLIVRGVLNRAGTMPPPEFPKGDDLGPAGALDLHRALPVDTVELNHGRLIGNVERVILVLFVAKGQYTALAFFFAAKGLIRSKDVERRAWADYLILGSLTSFLVAVAGGLLIDAIFRAAGR